MHMTYLGTFQAGQSVKSIPYQVTFYRYVYTSCWVCRIHELQPIQAPIATVLNRAFLSFTISSDVTLICCFQEAYAVIIGALILIFFFLSLYISIFFQVDSIWRDKDGDLYCWWIKDSNDL